MSARPALVIFDCDGVLVDSEPISNAVLAERLTACGLPTTAAEALATYRGMMLPDVIALAERRLGRPLPPDFAARYEAARSEAFARGLAPVAGAKETVALVRRAGVAVCVGTQGRPEVTELKLRVTGLRDLFDPSALFTSYEVARGKPHPDLFLHAAARMGAEPARCVVVEDTAIGARAGVAAGMRVLGFAGATAADRGALLAARAEPFERISQVPALIGIARSRPQLAVGEPPSALIAYPALLRGKDGEERP